MIYYIIAVDILAEKASTLKYASVISKKSETFSLIWFKELAWTAQKAAFYSDRWGGGKEKGRNYPPGAGDTQESATNFSSLCWRNYKREETSENWQRNPPCCRDLLLHHSEGCPAKTLTLRPWNPSSSHAVSKDPTNSRAKLGFFFCFKFQLMTVDQRKEILQAAGEGIAMEKPQASTRQPPPPSGYRSWTDGHAHRNEDKHLVFKLIFVNGKKCIKSIHTLTDTGNYTVQFTPKGTAISP